jgi:hypothetical protein
MPGQTGSEPAGNSVEGRRGRTRRDDAHRATAAKLSRYARLAALNLAQNADLFPGVGADAGHPRGGAATPCWPRRSEGP